MSMTLCETNPRDEDTSLPLCETEPRDDDTNLPLCEILWTSHNASMANREGEAPEASRASPSPNRGFDEPEKISPLCELDVFLCEECRHNTFEPAPSSEGEDSLDKGLAPSHNAPEPSCEGPDFWHNEEAEEGLRTSSTCETLDPVCEGEEDEGLPSPISPPLQPRKAAESTLMAPA